MPKKDYIVHPHYGFKISVEEEWRDVPGYEGLYQVSNQGRVKSLDRWALTKSGKRHYWQHGRVLSLGTLSGGYQTAVLCQRSRIKNLLVHSLVLLAFVGPAPEGMETCHFPDPNRKNNRLENLRWGSPRENAADRDWHGNSNKGKHYNQGEASNFSVLNEEQVLEIRKLWNGSNKADLAKQFRVNVRSIWCVVTRRTWRHV